MRRVSGIVVTSVLFCLAVAGQGRRPTLRGHPTYVCSVAPNVRVRSHSVVANAHLLWAAPLAPCCRYAGPASPTAETPDSQS